MKSQKFIILLPLLLSGILLGGSAAAQTNSKLSPEKSRTVGPLLQTRWGWGAPYTNMTPIVNGKRSNVSCTPIAMAQLIKYHNHPVRGSGQSEPYTTPTHRVEVPSVDFNVAYDWKNMLNTYPNANSGTKLQQNAVATLMYHVGISMKMDFGADKVPNTNIINPLVTFFGYDKSIQRLYRVYYDDATWMAIIKAQLDAGLPIYYHGVNSTKTIDHAFIIDGYNNSGKFHINWGWNGRDDGYYSLNALNPPSKKIYDFNHGNYIIINIKPDKGGESAGYEMGLLAFTSSTTSVLQNERFTVTFELRNISTFDEFPGGQMGVALVDNDDRIVAVIGNRNRRPLSVGLRFGGPVEINCSVSDTVKAGEYRLRIVTRPTGGEWRIVELSEIRNGVPSAIPFTVTSKSEREPEAGTRINIPGGGRRYVNEDLERLNAK